MIQYKSGENTIVYKDKSIYIFSNKDYKLLNILSNETTAM